MHRIARAGLGIAALIAAVACGGSEFTSHADAGAGGAGALGGSAGKGGSGGGSGAAGNPGGADGAGGGGGDSASAGAAGNGGGSPCRDVTCGSTEYCNSDTGKCAVCSSLARFRFGPPERLDAVSTLVAGNQRFPRVTKNNVEMFFRMGTGSDELSLWLTPDFSQPGSEQPFGPSVDSAAQSESGALEASTELVVGEAVNLFFDRSEVGPATRRELLVTLRSGTTSSNSIRLPAPFNTTGPVSSNYSIAVAVQAARAWWMTDRSDPQGELVTAALAAGISATPITITTAAGCARTGSDATPWVPPDASLMLVRVYEMDATCGTSIGPNDLYVVLLAPSGLPAGAALPLDDVNQAGWDDTDPSMSPDLCWLYFASDGGQDEFDVYRAPRR